jgi:electron transfer flavoprotein beta subunit
MWGIMMARTQPLTIIDPESNSLATKSVSFEKPASRGDVKLVEADNIDELINLLHKEAKVI